MSECDDIKQLYSHSQNDLIITGQKNYIHKEKDREYKYIKMVETLISHYLGVLKYLINRLNDRALIL